MTEFLKGARVGARDVAPALRLAVGRTGGDPVVRTLTAFDPARVRAWEYYNREGSGMDEASIGALTASIRTHGQQSPGLARKLRSGGEHEAEVVYGVRRLEACRRAGVKWIARVVPADYPDVECAALMRAENETSEGVSPLENAVQWKRMLEASVVGSQTALAKALGCRKGRISRAVKIAGLLDEDWPARLVRPVMEGFTAREAERLAAALDDRAVRREARVVRRAWSREHRRTASTAPLSWIASPSRRGKRSSSGAQASRGPWCGCTGTAAAAGPCG